jgi:3-oxoacyl-[acyl-carrier protein] reductase
VVNGRTEEKLQEVVGEIRAAGNKAEAAPADVLDEAAVQALVDGIIQRHGRVDLLVNAVGGGGPSKIADMSFELWQRVMNLNVNSAFLCTRACLPHMTSAKFGRITCIGSGALTGAIGLSNYSTAKAALIGFVKTVALEGAPYGVTANVLVLGHVDSPRWGQRPKEFVDMLMAQVPLGKFIPPDHVAGTIAFLASEDASNITGNVIMETGGMDWVGPTIDLTNMVRRPGT